MQRYFGFLKQGQICLCEDDIFHLTKVMRAKPGTQIEVVIDNKTLLCETASFNPLLIKFLKEIEENNELPNKIILICALLKGDHMDLVLQKATELGVSEIILLETERTIAKIKDLSKLERFRKILKEASEQSKRNKIPTLEKVIKMNELNTVDANIKMIAYEKEKGTSKTFNEELKLIKPNDKIAVIIGPEGGFSEEEVKLANEQSFVSIGLGKRILRAETASFYTLSIISNYLEKNNA